MFFLNYLRATCGACLIVVALWGYGLALQMWIANAHDVPRDPSKSATLRTIVRRLTAKMILAAILLSQSYVQYNFLVLEGYLLIGKTRAVALVASSSVTGSLMAFVLVVDTLMDFAARRTNVDMRMMQIERRHEMRCASCRARIGGVDAGDHSGA